MSRTPLTTAIVAALALGMSAGAYAATAAPAPQSNSQQSSSNQNAKNKKSQRLEQVTVTGSLIPQTEIETSKPKITITAEELHSRGFNTVAQALQQASFSTGAVQGAQDTNSFTPGAKTLSLFGLPVGFTKYLIDGRPLGNFPALYNGSDTFNNISGIPISMVDHIDILPGGQSSLYGSDAIAGVINIVLKKHIKHGTLDYRGGWYTKAGGASSRISFSDGFSAGNFNSVIGLQYENDRPIYAKDRYITNHFFQNGTSRATASRDELILSAFNIDGSPTGYQFLPSSDCSAVSNQWNGTEMKQYRKGSGYYCGSQYTGGAATLANGSKTANLYTHNTYDINDDIQLYGDLLYNYQETTFTPGSNVNFWSSSLYATDGAGYFFDPRINGGALLLTQKAFAPEEVGGYTNRLSKDTSNSYMLTLGVRGGFGDSNWTYDLGFTHSDYHLIQRSQNRLTKPMEQYFSNRVLGAQLGTFSGYPVYEPNYAGLYQPVSRADYESFNAYSDNHNKTWDNLVRGQITNADLFSLPGGDAGLAVVLEGGNSGFNISPDPGFAKTVTIFNGTTAPYYWGTSSTPTAGHRSRYAGTVEFRAPVLSWATLDASGRYDGYRVDSSSIGKFTYSLGLEFRPLQSLLLRGRYGTAFKAPTLSDEFQKPSGSYGFVYDYLNCGRQGYGVTTGNKTDCPAPYNSEQYNGVTSGNPKLQPITAKVWSYGVVWSPIDRMSISADYLHFDINNEVSQYNADRLSNIQYLCDIGTYDKSSTLCGRADEFITRGPGKPAPDGTPLLGPILKINRPKLNVANELVNAIQASFHYRMSIGWLGELAWSAAYTDELKHTYQQFSTDPAIDYLRRPDYSTDFKSKANASVTWLTNNWTSTLFVNRYGSTPNYAAQLAGDYTAEDAGTLAPWVIWNASVTYKATDNLSLSFLVNNLFNEGPRVDSSIPGTTNIPYNQDNYDPYGRAMYLEAKYTFDKF